MIKTYAQFVTEVLDKPYPHVVEKDHPLESHYVVKHPSGEHHVTIWNSDRPDHKGRYMAEVEFGTNPKPGKSLYGLSGDHARDSHRILASVRHIMVKHAERHPKLTHYEFSASEPSRQRLYSHITKRMGGETRVVTHDDPDDAEPITKHFIPIRRDP